MTALTLNERRRMTRLMLDRARRAAVSGVLHSPLLRWQFGAPVADELILVPQELRTADASFADELEQGLFGLGGTVAALGGSSVFDIAQPNEIWSKSLHGFGWLRHLSAAHTPQARRLAQQTVDEWIARHPRRKGLAWSPDIVGRRIFSWLANSDLVLADVDQTFYDRFTDSLGLQLIHLSARWRDVPGGLPRLVALNGLLTGALCISGHDKLTQRAETELAAELGRQIHDDGGHISRNPNAVVEVLLDLMPLQTCFKARRRPLPAVFESVIPRMLGFLQFMRIGDGSLARFNGMGATPFDTLATLAAYVGESSEPLHTATASRYVRLSRGASTLIADVGPPPDMENAVSACAGCLSFEFSSATAPIFVNGGTPGPADQDWLAQSRSTASHNTLVLGARSSARIVRHPALDRLIGGSPIRFPDNVEFSVIGDDDAVLLDCQHDGYRQRFGLLHRRRLRLAKNGRWLEAVEQISSAGQQMRFPRDIPFSIHFHLHPQAYCVQGQSPETVEIVLNDRSVWLFNAPNATLSVEESVHYGDRVGPTKSEQIVLRGSCFGDKSVNWRLDKRD